MTEARRDYSDRLALRWTIGSVSDFGFESLRLSVRSAVKLFGDKAAYAICVNSMPLRQARERTGPVPPNVEWVDCSDRLPSSVSKFFEQEEVTICSPFWPHRNHLGTCGAHFVGLNNAHLPFKYYDRAADDCEREHWLRLRPLIEERIGYCA